MVRVTLLAALGLETWARDLGSEEKMHCNMKYSIRDDLTIGYHRLYPKTKFTR